MAARGDHAFLVAASVDLAESKLEQVSTSEKTRLSHRLEMCSDSYPNGSRHEIYGNPSWYGPLRAS